MGPSRKLAKHFAVTAKGCKPFLEELEQPAHVLPVTIDRGGACFPISPKSEAILAKGL